MQRSKLRLAATFVAIGALTAALAGCGSSDKSSEGGSPTTTPSEPAAITVTAGDYSFEGLPETMTAGIQNVTFENQGSVDHEMVFVKVKPGTTPDALGAALEKVFNGEPFPAFMEAANGVANTAAGETTVTQFNLPAGDYIALCGDTGVAGSKKDGKPHFARGMYAEVTVTGDGGDEPPTADATITAKDYAFTMSGLKAGEQTVAFTNDGPKQWHFGDIQVFPAGTTVAQATDAVQKLLASQGPPPAGVPQPDTVATLQIASPGLGNTLPVTLLSGRTYVILCFVSDLEGGPPHAIAHQMYKVFTVS
jgi:plastocyanin